MGWFDHIKSITIVTNHTNLSVFMLSGSTRDQQEKDINYCSKARAGLARQEAVDERRYLSRVSLYETKNVLWNFPK